MTLPLHPAEFEASIVKLDVPGVLKVKVCGASQFAVLCIAVVVTESVPFNTESEGNLKRI